MPEQAKDDLTAQNVLKRVRAEIDHETPPASPLEQRIARIRSMQREFREQPIGGRLLPIKRVVYWFTASAFDRQAKVIEALFELVEDLAEENHRLESKLANALKGPLLEETGRGSDDR
jgi:hypothetical protein